MSLRLRLALAALPALLLMGLAASPAPAAWPGASGKIAFTWTNNNCPEFARQPCPTAFRHIATVNPDGSGVVDVSAAGGATNLDDDIQPSWSPDGTKIAFVRTHASLVYGAPAEDATQIWTMNADGSGQKQVTHEATTSHVNNPSWSPDGTKIVYVRDYESSADSGIAVTGADGSGTPQLLASGHNYNNPVWSPDGAQIAYFRSAEGPDHIFVMASDGTAQTDLGVFGIRPDWAPDSSRIVFFEPSETGVIKVMNRDGSNVVQITAPADLVESAQFSPDGTQMTYVHGFQEIGVMTSAGGSQHVIVAHVSGTKFTKGDWQPLPALTAAATVPACTATGALPVKVTETTGFKSPPKAVHYKIDGGAEQVLPTDATGNATVTVPNGTHTVEFWGEDTAGYTSVHSTAAVKVDTVEKCLPPAPKVGVAGVRRACVAKSFKLRFRIATAAAVKNVTVKLDGKRIASTKKGSFTLTINVKKLKAGRHQLVTTATDVNGKVTTHKRTISVCKAAKPRQRVSPRFTG